MSLLFVCVACATMKHGAPPEVGIASSSTSAKVTAGNPPQGDTGSFAFRIRYGSATFDGTLHTFGDSMTVESTYAHCTPVPHSRTSSGVVGTFNCTGMPALNDFALAFDARNPTERSYWTGSYTKRQPAGQECVMYTTNAQGQSVCARWQQKMVDTKVQVGDKILFVPRSP